SPAGHERGAVPAATTMPLRRSRTVAVRRRAACAIRDGKTGRPTGRPAGARRETAGRRVSRVEEWRGPAFRFGGTPGSRLTGFAVRQLAAQETRRKLLEAALEHFSRRPYADVTVADIARSAGVAQGLLSHHFNGKENLYAEVVCVIDRRLRVAAKIGPDGPAVERLRRHLAAHLGFLAENEDSHGAVRGDPLPARHDRSLA
ncbi:helix-turn-helix domain-containing protein, partial [Streptosporangium sp. NPDC048865]|uniref:TetR/AcrR family transcriptional regulator n=1 Tax=Streptosporangium sp. NPDC048865 TaxID=3155766 RepID=UPI00343805F4